MATRAIQGVLRRGYPLAKDSIKQICLAQSISTHSSASNVTRQIPQSAAHEVTNKSAYATVAPGHKAAPSTYSPSPKFRVPFDEGPTMSTLDNIVEHVENIPQNVQIERGYQIIGKVKTNEDQLKKILAIGDMRIWQ